MRSTPLRRVAVGGTATAVAGLLTAAGLGALPASAAACNTPQLRYASSSSNTLYLMSGSLELPQLKALCADIPLTQEGTTGTWYLGANLKVENGATLKISGGSSVSAANRVNYLKLRSEAAGTRDKVVEITAQYGTIAISKTKITSWDPVKNSLDTDTKIPSGVEGGKGRSFVRAVSFMEGNTARQSRMDIVDSDLSYLGYYGGEAYGVSYKARGCGLTSAEQAICGKLDVLGLQTGSKFHHNYFGTYTWGAANMTFDGNTYSDNVMYGLDPHDDSDNLKITNNTANNNGTHGIICSQRCDHLTITGNTVHSNGIPPYLPEGDTDASDNQVHGIMLHRGVTQTVVSNNTVYNHPNGAGIAIFDSMGDTVENNKIYDNKYGLRTSVGSKDITFRNNTVTNSSSHAVYAYPGVKDKSIYSNPSTSHPLRNTFVGNTFDGAKSTLVNILSSDEFTFTDNKVSGTVGPIVADSSQKLIWQGSKVSSTKGIDLRKGSKGTVVVKETGSFPLTMDGTGELIVTSPNGLLAEVSSLKLYSTVSGTTSTLVIPGSKVKSKVTVTVQNANAKASTGRLSARPAGFETATKKIVVRSASKKSAVKYRVGKLIPNKAYVVAVNGKKVLKKSTTARGTLFFSLSRKGAAGHTISIKPAG